MSTGAWIALALYVGGVPLGYALGVVEVQMNKRKGPNTALNILVGVAWPLIGWAYLAIQAVKLIRGKR